MQSCAFRGVSRPEAVDVELIARVHALKNMRAVDGHQAAGDVADVIRRTFSRRRC